MTPAAPTGQFGRVTGIKPDAADQGTMTALKTSPDIQDIQAPV